MFIFGVVGSNLPPCFIYLNNSASRVYNDNFKWERVQYILGTNFTFLIKIHFVLYGR